LIKVALPGQVGAFAADIRNRRHCVSRDFLLDVKMPLLHIGPLGLGWNRDDVQRKLWRQTSATTDVGVTIDVVLLNRIGQRGRVLQRFRVALVAVGMLQEDAVSASNRGLAVSVRIPGEPRCAEQD
jgi:hypothetical protein